MHSYNKLVKFPTFTEYLPVFFEISESSTEDHFSITFDPMIERFPTEILIHKENNISNYTLYGKLKLNLKSNREGYCPYFVYYRRKK